ncbi:MAG: HYExAFE family protein [Phycisphaeraceae bacterium]|nr:HYExAFE family protein [Phycisphaeraceae bacterium]
MAQRRHHYEVALESYLREHRIPYISVDEARRAILPQITPLRIAEGPALKAFDFVVYGASENLLIEVKGRRIARAGSARARPRLECWATRDDVDSLRTWATLFGSGFRAVLLFVYWCEEQPPDALFHETFSHKGRFYALRCIDADEYASRMRPRSPKWGTVDLSARDFETISHPFLRSAGVSGRCDPAPFAAMEPIGA